MSQVNGVTLIVRTASATGRPCDSSTSTCLSFATISSGLCFFCGILESSKGSKAYLREDHFSGGRPSLEDRRRLMRLREAKVRVDEIARQLGRHRSTIYRELKRNW